MSAWCRACGQAQSAQAGNCSACGVDLSVDEPAESSIGLVFEVRGKLGVGKKLGICVGVEGDSLLLHFSAKDKEPGRLPAGTQPVDTVPPQLGPASRLLYAADLEEGKQSWDRERLRSRASELCDDVRIARRLVDDGLAYGERGYVELAPLTASEKSWRAAHQAATTGDLEALAGALSALPSTGYPTRAALLLPHLGAIHHGPETWRPVLDGVAASGAPGGEAARAATVGSWAEALGTAASLTTENRRATWAAVLQQLTAGAALSAPPFHDTPAWTAASLVGSEERGRLLDGSLGLLGSLEAALWDDLVDAGRITRAADLAALPAGLRTYLLSRVDPGQLSDAEARDVGNTGEFARRLFLGRDKATLSGLDRTVRVEHYQALLEVVEGGRPDPRRLDDDTIRLLDLPTSVLGQIKDGAAHTLPPEVVADPSLWPMFADLAINGKLLPDPGRSGSDPLNLWIGAHRLLGLIWEGDLAGAVEHGRILAPQAKDNEVQEDEILNLTAYALFQLGRVDEALDLLEHALQGLYTENLLVNASIVAAQARPEVGVRYLARLVQEAPTPDLQRAGLDHAITVWQKTDLDFPQVLVPALRTVLSGAQPVPEYLRLGRVGVNVAPEVIGSLPNPGGELDGPYRLLQIRSRWKTDQIRFLSELAEQYIDLYRSVGRADWFLEDWKTWVETIRETVYVDFGDAVGSAQWIDTVLTTAPDLFTPEERFELAAQAGAHMAFSFRKENSWLTDSALEKFFLRPMDEFLASRDSIDPGRAAYLANNFALCAVLGAMNLYEVCRPTMADLYNDLNDRARWDSQNFIQIQVQKQRMLNEALSDHIAAVQRVLDRVRRLGHLDDKERDLYNDLNASINEWRNECERLLRDL